MDLKQTKLTKDEWVAIERPLDPDEQSIISLIVDGYTDVNVRRSTAPTLRAFLKVQDSKGIEEFIFVRYLQEPFQKTLKAHGVPYIPIKAKTKAVKKADLIRFDNADKQLASQRESIFEYTMLELVGKLCKQKARKSNNWLLYYYTLTKLIDQNISSANKALLDQTSVLLRNMAADVRPMDIFKRAALIVEANPYLSRFRDLSLYDHQRRLFTVCKRPGPKLVSYVAPTGTGKTLSPLGLLNGHRVIFVCAARHVGLALAKAAISAHRKIAFAFGCQGADDIRLHYFAAKEYTKNKRSGGIGKVDNSVGDAVEMMICDVKSYIPAMRYMLAFNSAEELITYWDEPTISMDYQEHEFHPMIHQNWSENRIPNMVLSSATLPRSEDIMDSIMDYKVRFPDAQHYDIRSHECSKSVRLIDTLGEVVMPHTIATTREDLRQVVSHCRAYPALMRHFDIEAAVTFLNHLHKEYGVQGERCDFEARFPTVDAVTSDAVKQYYLDTLESLEENTWEALSQKELSIKAFDSWIHVLTSDAYTVTNGPAIFLTNDVARVARFYLGEVNIPAAVASDLGAAISHNRSIGAKIAGLEKSLEDLVGDDDAHCKPEAQPLIKQIESLKNSIRAVMLPRMFIPNTREHMRRYVPDARYDGAAPDAFTSDITEQTVEEVMQIPDVDDTWKILLLLGVGAFTEHKSPRYLEIMKRLADEQKLFMVIASGDYVYGTNYQFCHGCLGKDMADMSQEKCIQAMGRVGRGKQNHSYSIRFRSEELLSRLFHEVSAKPEADNMRRLFSA